MSSLATIPPALVEALGEQVDLRGFNLSAVTGRLQERDEILRKVRNALDQDGRRAFRRISISLNEDRILLRGTVNTWFQKQMAQHLVMQVPGTPRVVNELVVDPNRLPGFVN